ncbi:MAG: aspartate kinase, partial [Flavobacteriaceae bacterium]
MKVLKFGGTSVADTKSLSHVIAILKNTSDRQFVVVSALGGITNLLIQMAEKASEGNTEFQNELSTIEQRHLSIIQEFIPLTHQSEIISFLKTELNKLEALLDSIKILRELTPKSLAKVSSFGELLSSKIIFSVLQHQHLDIELKDARTLIFTHQVNDREIVNHQKSRAATQKYNHTNSAQITLVPGFIATDENNEITTLGRGGSDYSASLLANYLEASQLEIWTDVSGMFTAHPSIVAQALPISKLSYQEAMELSHFGAKVIYPPTLQPLIEKKIPIFIKNTFDAQAEGTLIDENGTPKGGNGTVVKGVSHIEKVALITLEGSGMIGIPGFSKRLFECLSLKQINVIMITQASSEHSICIGVRMEDAEEAKKAIDSEFEFEISLHKLAPAKVELNMTNIAVVGDYMKEHQGISGKLFSS